MKPLDMDLGSAKQHEENPIVSAVAEVATDNALDLTQKDGELPQGMDSLSRSKNPNEQHENSKICITEDIDLEPIRQNLSVKDEELLKESIPNEQGEKATSSVTSEIPSEIPSVVTLEDLLRQHRELTDGKSIMETEENPYHSDEKQIRDTDGLVSDTKLKGAGAVSSFFRRLSGRSIGGDYHTEGTQKRDDFARSVNDESGSKEASQQIAERSWNPFSYIKLSKTEQKDVIKEQNPKQEPTRKGRVILYTRLGCPTCRVVRLFFQWRQIKYTEINIDIYPSRKLELENNTGSSAVPKVYFNDLLVVDLNMLKSMDESGKLADTLKDLINEEPSDATPLPPFSGEDDLSGTGVTDDSAVIVRQMREHLALKDRYYKVWKFTKCFLGSEAVDFLSNDQYLERDEAIELGRKLGQQLFFQHVFHENVFEDGKHVYRFLDHDPDVMTRCYNIPRGMLDLKPKPVIEIASRLRFVMFAMFEAYVSQDGKHVDYRRIRRTEEYARYLRIVEELQRVDLKGLSREEKLAFFINLYNMMVIHAILTWGFPLGILARRRMFYEFKYVVGGSTYSLSGILDGILRGNRRPLYSLLKPFGSRDRQAKIALAYPEPLVHFALVFGNNSSPALRCYSPANIDKELTEAAKDFLRNRGFVVDFEARVVHANEMLRWYSADFGKNEIEVLKYAANYLEPPRSAQFLELLAKTKLKVRYQAYDWSQNR